MRSGPTALELKRTKEQSHNISRTENSVRGRLLRPRALRRIFVHRPLPRAYTFSIAVSSCDDDASRRGIGFDIIGYSINDGEAVILGDELGSEIGRRDPLRFEKSMIGCYQCHV